MTETTPIDAAMTTLEALTYKDLKSVRARIETLMEQKRHEAEADLERRRQQLVLEFDLAETPKPKALVRYRDPDNSDNTWSGRGRQPQWLTDKIEGGAPLESFEV